jgi:ribosomal protein S3
VREKLISRLNSQIDDLRQQLYELKQSDHSSIKKRKQANEKASVIAAEIAEKRRRKQYFKDAL